MANKRGKSYHSGNVMKSGLHMLKKGSVVHAPGSSNTSATKAPVKPAEPANKPLIKSSPVVGSRFYGE